MDSQRLSVEEIFHQAIEEDPAQRQAFLETMCGDSKVRTRVEALLKAHDNAGAFLSGPAVQPAPSARTPAPATNQSEPTSIDEALNFLARCDKPGRLGLLAHYEIVEVLGRGGMGVVLRGVDVRLNRVVAIKVLAPQLAANAMARQRFQREAQAAAAVSHHHVVAIHAVDEFNGLPYLVMEYISGPSLQQKIEASGALSLAQILRIGMQIASGLAAAHAHGLVHRDIKPANILLENGVERVKITDFGLARSIDDVRMTQAGAVYGTPQYMSPEQAQGERVDQRSDLFSLGSVLYAMSTGRSPFRGDTSLAVLKRVCEDTPRPIREVNPDMPAALVQIVNKLLAKNPEARFQTANEVTELLSRYLAHLQHDPHTAFRYEAQVQPPIIREDPGQQNAAPKGTLRSRPRKPMLIGAAVLLTGIAVLAALEGAGLTNLLGRPAPKLASINPLSPLPTPDKGSREKVDVTPKIKPSDVSKTPPGPEPGTARPVKVFILVGDSNMEGRAATALLKSNPARTKEYFQHLLRDDGLAVRDDVWIKTPNRKGNLSAGFGQDQRFGPELEFGNVVGDYFAEQVLLIKCCWGGQRLSTEFRPPSSGLAPPQFIERRRKQLLKQKPNATPADVERSFGESYRAMVANVRQTLANLGELFPAYQGQGYELAGVVYFCGWTDMLDADYAAYTDDLANFIRDARADLNAPNLPFIIGQLGVETTPKDPLHAVFKTRQAAVARLPEFAGNVKLVDTDIFWDHEAYEVYKKGWATHKEEWDRVGSDFPFHYLGSAKTICQIGKAFGQAMIELCRSEAKK